MELDLTGRRVMVHGGSAALGLIARLLAAGAVVHVSDTSSTSVRDLLERGLISDSSSGNFAAVLNAEAIATAASGDASTTAPGERTASAESSAGADGLVTLVGGGPGDPGLLTVAGLEAIRSADVVVYDRLAPLALLDEAPPGAELIDVGKIPRGEFTPQERINEVLIDRARAGAHVVRFKGGDSFVFGRGGEESQACSAVGIAVRVIPGVSSAIAVPELAGIPVTHRTLSQGFAVVSGHVPPGDERSSVDWDSLATSGLSIVVLMGVANLGAICTALISGGLESSTPAAVVADGGLPSQQVVRADLATLAEAAARGGVGSPAVTVIGAVAGLSPF